MEDKEGNIILSGMSESTADFVRGQKQAIFYTSIHPDGFQRYGKYIDTGH